MDIGNFVQFLQTQFPEGRIASGGNEFVCRCRLCGDSVDINKSHFYISLNHPTGLIMYNCFKCNAGGVLTPTILSELCDVPPDIATGLIALNKSRSRGIHFNPKKSMPVLRYGIDDTPANRFKLDYVSKRIGVNLTYQDIINNKIVFDLNRVLYYNHIEPTRHEKIMRELSDFFIGFIGMDNSKINLRNLNLGRVYHSIDQRYINYNIYGNATDSSKRFYTIPTTPNVSDVVRINIAEGPFDVLSIFYNMRNQNRGEIYTAVGNKSYVSVVKMWLSEYGIILPEFHIYADNDVQQYYFNKIFMILKPLEIPLYIHHNHKEGEKDYGVPLSQIVDYYERLI